MYKRQIEKVVRDAKAALPEAVIYVYNNNSTDRTAELAEKAGAVAVSYTHLLWKIKIGYIVSYRQAR